MKIKNKLLLVSVLSTSIVLGSKDVEASSADSLSPSLVLDQEELKKELEIADIVSKEENKEEPIDNSADEKELSPIKEDNSKKESLDKVEGLEEPGTITNKANKISDDDENVEPIEDTNSEEKEANDTNTNLPPTEVTSNEEKTDPVASNPEDVGQKEEDSIDKKETTEKLNQTDDVLLTEQKEEIVKQKPSNEAITDEEDLKTEEPLEKQSKEALEKNTNILPKENNYSSKLDRAISTFAVNQPFDESREDPIPEEQPSRYGTTTFTLNTELSPLIGKDELDFEALPERFIIYYGEGGKKEKEVSRQELANNIILESVDFETKEEYENYRNNYEIYLVAADQDEDDRKFEITYYDNQDQTGLGEITSNDTILGVKVELRQVYNPRLDVDTSDLKNRKEIYDDEENSIPITIDWQGIEARSKLTTDMGMEKDSDGFYQPSGLGLAFEYIEDREAEPDLYYTNAEGNRVLLEKNSVLSIDGKNYTVVEYIKDPVKGVYVNLRPEAERKNINIKPTLNGLDGKNFNPNALPENMTLVYRSDDSYKELNVSREDFINGVLLGNIEYISEADRNEALANLKLIKAADNSKNKLTYYVESITDPTPDEDGNYNINININQVQNPNLTVKWYNKDGERLYGPENDEGKITIDWGESTDDSKLITDPGITRDYNPTGLGLAYENISNRRKTPKILYEGKELVISTPVENELKDEDGNEIVTAPFVEGTIVNYNGKKYIVTENSIDDINGASISLKEFVSKEQGEEWKNSDTNDSEANTKDIFGIPENAQVEENQEEIPFEYETIYDEELPEGYHKIEVKGENGEKVISKVIDPNTGEVIDKTESIIKRPVIQVERVGTLVKNQESITKEEVKIAYETEIIADDTLELGKTIVDKEGKEGIKTITYTTKIKNDEVVDVIRDEKITVNPETRVVRVGTKTEDIENEVVTTEKKVIPHETEIIPDPTLALGETIVDTEGHDGEITVTNTTKVVNGVVGKTERREEITKEAETRVVRVGTKAEITNVVTHTDTKVLPFETEVIPDNTLDLGETVVEEEGENGEITITYKDRIVNGELDETTKSEEVTKAPKTKTVRVGTYTPDIENTIVNTEKKRIDYETEVIFDDTIELGKEVVENEGEYGEVTVTFTTEVINGAVIRNDRKETITKQPVTRVVRVGTKTEDQRSEVVTTNKKTIHHETEIIFDDSLELGKTEIVTKGRDGEITITNKTTVINGAVGETVTSEKITIYPITEVVKVGTKTDDIKSTVTNTEVRPIDYETEVIFDDTIELGKTVVEKEGEKGELTITFTNEVVNGVVGKTNRVEKVTKEPVARVVRVGTKTEDTHSTVVNKVEKKIPYETEIIPDDSLDLGKSVVEKEGEEGILTETYTTEVINGVAGETKVDSRISKQPSKRVVRIGTKTEGYNHVVITKNTKPIPHETEIIPDDTLPLGETVVVVEGHDGEITITNRTPIVEGVEGKTTSTEDITKDPETRVVRVGTKTSEIVVSKSTRPIPHETEIIFDDTLQLGQTKVVEEGADGMITVTHTVPIENGIAGEVIITEEISKQPTTRVVKVGTKTEDQKSTVVTTDKRPIAHKTDVIFDKDLELGKVIVDEEGRDGELTITKTTPVVNGAVGKTETTEKITKEAVTRVVRVGTKYEDIKPTYNGEFVTTDTRKIPFETEVIFDNTLDLGKTITETKGEEGEITTTYTLKIENGKVISTSKDEKVTKNPIPEVIRIGTLDSQPSQPPKETIREIVYEDIDFKTEYQYDPTRYVGDDKLVTKGENGKKKIVTTSITVDGNTTTTTDEEVIKETVNEVWIIGTKKIDPEIQPKLPELEYKVLPLEVEYITDDSLDEDVKVIIQEGQAAVYAIDENGEYIYPALREGKVRIIKRGTKKPSPQINYIDEKIRIQYIDTDLLVKGKEVVISEGQAGKYYIDQDGNKVYVVQPMDRVVLRGIGRNNSKNEDKPALPPKNPDIKDDTNHLPNDNSKVNDDIDNSTVIEDNSKGDNSVDTIDPAEVDKLIYIMNNPLRNFKNDGNSNSDTDNNPSKQVDEGNKDSEKQDISPDKNNKQDENEVGDIDDNDINPSRMPKRIDNLKDGKVNKDKNTGTTPIKNIYAPDNPKTGINGSLGIAGILAAASTGYFASKKKESDEK